MTPHEDNEFSADYWEDRYRNGGGASRLDPSPSLLAEAADLPPGTALDAGCGWGADALWLAARGWTVTAVDVSPAAVDQARQAAEAADPQAAAHIAWTPADLTTWDPGPGGFDLVTSHYVHVPGTQEALFARLASWVAPGGTLLVVGHGHTPVQHGHGHGGDHPGSPPDTARVRLAQITAALPDTEWEIVAAEPRTHTISRPGGGPPAVLDDVLVRAHRIVSGLVPEPTATHGSAAPQSPQEWDSRYAGAEQVWSGDPNGALVAETAGLPAGRALDVGCGEGADAVWLARRGWDVTALDVSAVALDRARRLAEQEGVQVRWLSSGLLDAPLPPGGFDLVSVQYPALLRTPGDLAEHALLRAVAPGGLLLVVHHADVDADHVKAAGFDPADYVGHDDVTALFGDGWQVEAAERRRRNVKGGGGGHHTHDLVLKARRLTQEGRA